MESSRTRPRNSLVRHNVKIKSINDNGVIEEVKLSKELLEMLAYKPISGRSKYSKSTPVKETRLEETNRRNSNSPKSTSFPSQVKQQEGKSPVRLSKGTPKKSLVVMDDEIHSSQKVQPSIKNLAVVLEKNALSQEVAPSTKNLVVGQEKTAFPQEVVPSTKNLVVGQEKTALPQEVVPSTKNLVLGQEKTALFQEVVPSTKNVAVGEEKILLSQEVLPSMSEKRIRLINKFHHCDSTCTFCSNIGPKRGRKRKGGHQSSMLEMLAVVATTSLHEVASTSLDKCPANNKIKDSVPPAEESTTHVISPNERSRKRESAPAVERESVKVKRAALHSDIHLSDVNSLDNKKGGASSQQANNYSKAHTSQTDSTGDFPRSFIIPLGPEDLRLLGMKERPGATPVSACSTHGSQIPELRPESAGTSLTASCGNGKHVITPPEEYVQISESGSLLCDDVVKNCALELIRKKHKDIFICINQIKSENPNIRRKEYYKVTIEEGALKFTPANLPFKIDKRSSTAERSTRASPRKSSCSTKGNNLLPAPKGLTEEFLKDKGGLKRKKASVPETQGRDEFITKENPATAETVSQRLAKRRKKQDEQLLFRIVPETDTKETIVRRVYSALKHISKEAANSEESRKNKVPTGQNSSEKTNGETSQKESPIGKDINNQGSSLTENLYQDQAVVVENLYEVSAVSENICGNPAVAVNLYGDPAVAEDLYEVTAVSENMYEDPAVAEHFYEVTAVSENMYEDTAVAENLNEVTAVAEPQISSDESISQQHELKGADGNVDPVECTKEISQVEKETISDEFEKEPVNLNLQKCTTAGTTSPHVEKITISSKFEQAPENLNLQKCTTAGATSSHVEKITISSEFEQAPVNLNLPQCNTEGTTSTHIEKMTISSGFEQEPVNLNLQKCTTEETTSTHVDEITISSEIGQAPENLNLQKCTTEVEKVAIAGKLNEATENSPLVSCQIVVVQDSNAVPQECTSVLQEQNLVEPELTDGYSVCLGQLHPPVEEGVNAQQKPASVEPGSSSAYCYSDKQHTGAAMHFFPEHDLKGSIVWGLTDGRKYETGLPPIDQRGKHLNRPLALSGVIVDSIVDHIRSFRGRHSHYALHDTRKLYLPEELNVSKMYQMYKEKFPEFKVSRESYRKIFTEKFNISFGFPRKDTCSTCDKLNVILQAQETPADVLIQNQQEKELHLRKAQIFYDRKAAARRSTKTNINYATLAFDFAKNLSCPNITTNEVYYRRQLFLYTFIIHSLGEDSAHMFCYDETSGKKGSDDVASMLLFYFDNYLPKDVTHLELFCDSCAGQNKNWTVFRFLHYVVVHIGRFQQIKVSFPERGHSYMECDRDMALVNQKVRAETPEEWMREFSTCRTKPSPFNVVKMESYMFQNITEYIKCHYRAVCPVPTPPIREIIFSKEHPRMFEYRDTWHGPFQTAVVSKAVGRRSFAIQQPLVSLYPKQLPVSDAKYADLQVLKVFCKPEAQNFFSTLPHVVAESVSEFESDNE